MYFDLSGPPVRAFEGGAFDTLVLCGLYAFLILKGILLVARRLRP